MSNVSGYSKTQIGLHWLVVLLLVPQFLLDDAMGHTFHQMARGSAVTPDFLTYLHIGVGVTILVLAAWRLILRATQGAPEPPHDDPELMRFGAKAIHWLLYAILFLLPATGGIAYYFTIRWMAEVHSALTTGLLICAGLHVAAALYHQYYLKDHLLRRMMKPVD
ncbi:MAG: cytochrome b/b6 domain-containing protein [Rhodobacteraceae bacterium]|nr:cytochrome b/b6 domain-containing protein [Paracoccaceae bacterium]